MSDMPDWTAWLLAAAVLALFGWFFWQAGSGLISFGRQLIATIQNWPQTRRAMVEAEVRAGGRYPLWFRAVRAFLILAMIGLMVLLLWRRLGNFN
jgi:hypothetical protein